MASADDAAPAPDEGAEVVITAQDEEAEIGDGLFIERPAPRPDPGSELRSDPDPVPAPAPAPASTPAPAPAASAAPSGGVSSPAAQTTAAATTPATLIPARPTEVRGVQIERSAATPSADGSVALARTGVDTRDLTVLAGALLALGALLTRTARPRRITV